MLFVFPKDFKCYVLILIYNTFLRIGKMLSLLSKEFHKHPMFFITSDDPAIHGRLNECLETILNKAQVSFIIHVCELIFADRAAINSVPSLLFSSRNHPSQRKFSIQMPGMLSCLKP